MEPEDRKLNLLQKLRSIRTDMLTNPKKRTEGLWSACQYYNFEQALRTLDYIIIMVQTSKNIHFNCTNLHTSPKTQQLRVSLGIKFLVDHYDDAERTLYCFKKSHKVAIINDTHVVVRERSPSPDFVEVTSVAKRKAEEAASQEDDLTQQIQEYADTAEPGAIWISPEEITLEKGQLESLDIQLQQFLGVNGNNFKWTFTTTGQVKIQKLI